MSCLKATTHRPFRLFRFLGVCLGLYVFGGGSFATATPAPAKALYRVVGVLKRTSPLARKHPSEYCLRDDGRLYRAVPFYVGSLKVYAADPKMWSAFVGKIVIVEGTYHRDLNKILAPLGVCPPNYGRTQQMMQMRSDWVAPETGFLIGHSTKAKLARVSYLSLQRVLPFSGIRLEKNVAQGARLFFRVSPSLRAKDLVITAHYEGGRGKPRPHYIRTFLHWRDDGKQLQLSLPLQRSTSKGFSWSFGEDKILQMGFPYRLSLARSRAARRFRPPPRYAWRRHGYRFSQIRIVSAFVPGQLSYRLDLPVR